MNKSPLAISIAVTSFAGLWLAFSVPADAAAGHAKFELDASPDAASDAPDPLTPPEVNGPAPVAPGAPAHTTDTASSPSDVDPVVLAVREQLGSGRAPASSGDRDDHAGLVSYYAGADKPIWVQAGGFTSRAKQAVAEIGAAGDWGLRSAAFDLPQVPDAQTTRETLAVAEIKLSAAVLKYARHARGGRVDPQSISLLLDQKPVIFDPKSVLEAIAAADGADLYLRGLHPAHPQFELLRQAFLKAKGAGQKELANRLLANMERWRWMPADLGRFHVWDSVPEQMTRIVDDGKVVLSEKIVVGKPNTPTPVFSAPMQFVIFHPEWGVPDGIKVNELAPRLRQTGGGFFLFGGGPSASSVLTANGLRVTYNGRPIDPDSVNWSSADIRNYSFIQSAGPTNVLGNVKFRFPNKHDVYMHDTPERHLFGGSMRAFSHGCMRVQNPMLFAEVLLAHDKGWSKDKVQEYERRGGEVTLSTQIPVHVTYFTAVAEPDGQVRYFPDIYGLDGRVASAVEGSQVRVAAASEAAPAKEEVATRKPAPVARTVRKPSPVTAEPWWNPFSNN